MKNEKSEKRFLNQNEPILVNDEESKNGKREEEKRVGFTNISAIRSKKGKNWNHKKESKRIR